MTEIFHRYISEADRRSKCDWKVEKLEVKPDILP